MYFFSIYANILFIFPDIRVLCTVLIFIKVNYTLKKFKEQLRLLIIKILAAIMYNFCKIKSKIRGKIFSCFVISNLQKYILQLERCHTIYFFTNIDFLPFFKPEFISFQWWFREQWWQILSSLFIWCENSFDQSNYLSSWLILNDKC